MTILTAKALASTLKTLGTPEKAKASAWFFKTGKGHYGYGDVFWGVTVPEQRVVAKKFRALPLREVRVLLGSKIHECRLTALFVLVYQYDASSEAARGKIVKEYLSRLDRVNNWDLVDSSASHILRRHMLQRDRSVLYKLAQSENMWHRRVAIVSTFAFIRKGEYPDTLKIAEMLLGDRHDLIHKATGWMLREVGNRSVSTLERFLKKYAGRMPRTMLRYAIEKFPEGKRKMYLIRGPGRAARKFSD